MSQKFIEAGVLGLVVANCIICYEYNIFLMHLEAYSMLQKSDISFKNSITLLFFTILYFSSKTEHILCLKPYIIFYRRMPLWASSSQKNFLDKKSVNKREISASKLLLNKALQRQRPCKETHVVLSTRKIQLKKYEFTKHFECFFSHFKNTYPFQ